MASSVSLIVDLDTPCYIAAAVVETRSVIVTHNPTGIKKEFSTKTDFKNLLKSKNKLDRLEEYSFEDRQVTEDVFNACQILKSHINKVIEYVSPDTVHYMISGNNNFRNALEYPKQYKSNRVNVIKPLLLHEVQNYARNKYKPEVVNGFEPDDLQVIIGYEELRRGNKPIMLLYEKDGLAYSGLYVYNPNKEDGIFEIPKLGSLYLDSKGKLRGNGFLWYAAQVTMGDPVDLIKPTCLSSARFGEKSAFKEFKDCSSEQEALERIISLYKKWYPSPVTYICWDGRVLTKNWVEIYDMMHKGVRMKVSRDDDLCVLKFCKERGIEIEFNRD